MSLQGITVLAAEASAEIVHVGGWFLSNAWIIPAIPAASFFGILFFGKRLPRGGSELGIIAVGASLVLALCTVGQWISTVNGAHGAAVEPVVNRWTWWVAGGVDFTIGTLVDGLAVALLFVVTAISLLVHIYSTDYVAGDVRYTHFFAFLSLFTAAMLFFVLAENTIQMIVGWELVGVCSFVLIGHWWEEKPNSDAALKAFLTNRVGDIGLLVGVSVLFFAAGGTFSILEINTRALDGEIGHTLLLISALCLLAAVISKSGQFFLHTWLPDAMAGPTPVSALIHAATMVVAGVYLVARLYGVFFEGLVIAGSSINALALIGGLTTLVGASLAFVQNDIKRVLAYSTISQLGYMVMALGVGAWTAAIFHLFTHAFFKACLFLGSGSVSHAVHSFDMKKDMGGLRRHMPHTFRTFVIASLALAGLPPLAGFWSKDEILAGTGGWGVFGGTGGNGAYTAMLVMGMVTAALTAAYMTRCVYLTFFGSYRGHGHPHESGRRITVPLWILAVFAVGAGWTNLPKGFQIVPKSWTEQFGHYVEPVAAEHFYFPAIAHATPSWTLAIFSTLVVLVGAGTARGLLPAGRPPGGGRRRGHRARRRPHEPLGGGAPGTQAARAEVLPGPPLHRHRGQGHGGTRRPGRLLVQPARDRRGCEPGGPQGGRSRARGLRQDRPEGHRRRGEHHRCGKPRRRRGASTDADREGAAVRRRHVRGGGGPGRCTDPGAVTSRGDRWMHF